MSPGRHKLTFLLHCTPLFGASNNCLAINWYHHPAQDRTDVYAPTGVAHCSFTN